MVHFDRNSSLGSEAAPLRICIAAVGGAGSNVLERIIKERTLSASMINIQTDVRVLSTSSAPHKMQLGDALMKGVGAGGDPELGREGAMFSADQIRNALSGHDMVFLTVGLGGGTGSGAAPVVAEIAKSTGALVLVFAAVPFSFEGRRRQQQSREALDRLEKTADALILFENDRMGELVLAKDGIQKAFTLADRTVGHSIRAVANMVSAPGLVKLSLGDLMAALRSTDSRCLFGHGEASGKDRGTEALKAALKSPLLSETMLHENATSLLVHIVGGEGMTLTEVDGVMRQLGRYVPDHTQIHFGLGVNPAMGDKVSVTLISSMSANALAHYRATAPQAITAPVPVPQPKVQAVSKPAVAAVSTAPATVERPETEARPVVSLAQTLKSNAVNKAPTAAPAAVKTPAAKPAAQSPTVSQQVDDLFADFVATPLSKPVPLAPPPDFFSDMLPAVQEKPQLVEAKLPALPIVEEVVYEPEAEVMHVEEEPAEPLFEPVAQPMEQPIPQRLASVLGQAIATSSTYTSKLDIAVDEVVLEEMEPEAVHQESVMEEEAEYEPEPVVAQAPAVLTPMPETAPVPRALPVLSRVPTTISTTARATAPAVRPEPSAMPEVVSAPRVEPTRSIVSSTAVPASVRTLAQPQEQPMLAIAGGAERSNHFRGADETIVQGEDLDTPTWMRLRRKVTR